MRVTPRSRSSTLERERVRERKKSWTCRVHRLRALSSSSSSSSSSQLLDYAARQKSDREFSSIAALILSRPLLLSLSFQIQHPSSVSFLSSSLFTSHIVCNDRLQIFAPFLFIFLSLFFQFLSFFLSSFFFFFLVFVSRLAARDTQRGGRDVRV